MGLEARRQDHGAGSRDRELACEALRAREGEIARSGPLEWGHPADLQVGIAVELTAERRRQILQADRLHGHRTQRATRTAIGDVRTTAAELLPRKYSVMRFRP